MRKVSKNGGRKRKVRKCKKLRLCTNWEQTTNGKEWGLYGIM